MPLRLDIQALRGWAVLLVVLHHAGLHGLPAGFLGVDIFFVISGFLITGLIRDALAEGRFSLAEFYLRRARRLLPAACVTGMLTGLAAVWVLEPPEQRDLLVQLLGAASFSANFVLWRQAGYFDGAAELKPLLHMWSLSLEEQYYLLLPGLLLLSPARHWRRWVLGLSLLSLVACWLVQQRWPSAAFYLLPTRAWELGLGSLAALLPAATRSAWQPLLARLRWPALGLLLGLPLLPLGGVHPGGDALLITLATALLLLRQPAPPPHVTVQAQASRLNRWQAWGLWPWVKLGDASYSVYLVHWPLFALLNNSSLAEPPLVWRLLALLAALLLGGLLHRGVEQPLRHIPLRPGWPALGWGVGLNLLMVGVPAAVLLGWGHGGSPQQADASRRTLQAQVQQRRPSVGFDASCDQDSAPYAPLPACRNSAAPRTVVWGDSFGMHLIPALAETTAGGVEQITRSTCSPLDGLAPLDDRDHPQAWAQACANFNQSVLQALEQRPEVEVVVLSSPFMHLVSAQDLGRRWQLLETHTEPSDPRLLPASVPVVAQALARTVARLRAMGKRVVIVGPPPWIQLDPARCHARLQAGLFTLGSSEAAGLDAQCRISQTEAHRQQAPVLALLDAVAQQARVPVLHLHPWLCADGHCITLLEGVPLYRDARHLSHEGAELLGRRWPLGQQLQALAR